MTVVGFFLGGWIAAELASRNSPRIGRVVIVDGVGIEVDGHPVADVSELSPPEISALSYHDPSLAVDPATLTEAQRSETVANIGAVVGYGGTMVDPGLLPPLAEAQAPTLVLWGESDGIVDVEYGRAYAQAFARARFEVLPKAGHLPQIEQPAALADALSAFVQEAE